MIRPYEARDLDALLDVWFAASRLAHPFLSAEFMAEERRSIANKWLPIAETWVFESAGRVVGFIALIDHVVGALFVEPGRHGQGIGRALMDHARGLRGALDVEVFEANAIGRRFYAAYGFVPVGSSVHEESGQPVLTLRLEAQS